MAKHFLKGKPQEIDAFKFNRRFVIIVFILLFQIGVNAQSALGQLETWAGASIGSVSVSSASSPWGNTAGYKNPFEKSSVQLQNEAQDHFEKAQKYFNARNWDNAIHQLRKATRKDPYNQNYKNKLQEAINAQDKERQQNKDYQDRIKQLKEQQVMEQEEIRRKVNERLEKERLDREAIQQKLKEAEKTIISFKRDIKYAQGLLKNYSKALISNNGEMEKWATTADDAYKNVLDNSLGYLGNMFIKYNLLKGIQKSAYVKEIYNKMGNLWKSPNPEIQKWLARELKQADIRIDEIQDLVDRVNLTEDAFEIYLSKDRDQPGRNLKMLMFINGILETAHISSYENLIKNVEKPFGDIAMPGEYFDQAKMIGETYSDIAVMCYSWYSVRKINAGNEEMAQKISLLSSGMEQRMKQIDCLEDCMKRYSDRCLENCTGKTRWSTPPPPLLFEHRNW